MTPRSRQSSLSTIRSKIIAVFLLSCVTISVALYITYQSFQGLLTTVDKLTSPSGKVNLLNSLYRQITQLDQLQRAEVITNPNQSYTSLLRESQSVILTIDTLKAMPWENNHQMNRLSEMKNILVRRDKVLLSYLKIKSQQLDNKEFLMRFDSLAEILSYGQMKLDTNLTTTEHHITGSTEDEEKKSLLSRLFSKKKYETSKETRIEILRELSITIDSSAIAQQDSTIAEISRIMTGIEEKQRLQTRQIYHRELNLIHANNNLIRELLKILQEVEHEEKVQEEAKNSQAFDLVNKSILRIGSVILIFLIGTAILFGFILADITKSIRLRKELIKAKEIAEESEKVKQRFLANMSHEIRTPLQSILGFTEQLRHINGSDKESISAIHHSSEHLLHIVNEILDISKIESGKLVFERVNFDLQQTLQEVESSIQVQAKKKNLDLKLTTIDLPSRHLIGDSFRLKQILFNLLGNAIKFTQQGSVELRVIAKTIDYMVTCRFEIIDTGIGMEKEELNHIFEQFEQAKSSTSKEYGGTGLGLTIVKNLIEAQHGQLTVESTPGVGSVFTVELKYDVAPPEKGNKIIAPDVKQTRFEGKVIVVDDDEMILKLCSLILTKYHIEHLLFSDSEKAINITLHDDIKLILLDIRMPRISGIELCQEFKSRAKTNIKIVALTAHVLPQEKQSLMNQGFDYVLTKPFREGDLIKQLGLQPEEDHTTTDLFESDNELTLLKQMTLGDQVLLSELINQLVTDTRSDVFALEEEMNQLNPSQIREQIHRLAGRTGQVGAGKLSATLKSIELDLAEGKSLQLLAERILNAIDHLKNWLRNVELKYLQVDTKKNDQQ